MIPPYKGSERNLTGNEVGNLPDFALFNIKEEPEQFCNIADKEAQRLEEMKSRFFALTKGFYRTDVEEEELK